jgi:uncharacterized protein YceH (UPF0502 family)
MSATESEAQVALDSLKRRTLVIESYGASGRVMRYAHNMPKAMGLNQAQTALLAVLMLRGPQTSGELRINCDRIYAFADLSSVEAYLEELAARALAVRLPRAAGSREPRWAQLLCGPAEVSAEPPTAPAATSNATGELAALKANLASLREEVSELRAVVERLANELGAPK